METSARVTSPEDLGRLAREVRKRQGLTQAEVAAACGTGTRFISEFERGKPTCRVGEVLHVLRMLGIELRARGPDGR